MKGFGGSRKPHVGDGRSTDHDHGESTTISPVRLPELAVGIFIVAASIGGAVFWQRSVEAGTAVLVVARDVRRGDVLTRNDLAEVVLTSSADIALIRSSAVNEVVGRRVTADVKSGTPLVPAFLTTTGILGTLDGLVGLTVQPSSAPVDLVSGDVVRIFTVEETLDGETRVDEVPGPLEVWNVDEIDPLSSERAITVRLPLESIPSLVGRERIHFVKVVG